MKNNNILIIGCGWLGFPLATQLLKSGFSVTGTTRNLAKKTFFDVQGIEHQRFNIENPEECEHLSSSLGEYNTVVVSLPPSSSNNYAEGIKSLFNNNSKCENIIYISSTSIYNPSQTPVTEETNIEPISERQKVLAEAENVIINCKAKHKTILRLGGLIGYDRHPAKYLAGRKNIADGEAPVNLVHIEDCVGAVITLIQNPDVSGVYNLVSPEHPAKSEYYTYSAKKLLLPLPEFVKENKSGKIVSAEKICKTKGFEFKYNSPYDMI